MFEAMKPILIATLILARPVAGFAADSSKVKEKASETASAAGEYAKETREDFKKGVESDLAKLQTEINELKQKATEASGAAQDSLDRQIAELDVKKTKLKKKLDEASKTTNAAWAEMRTGISKALDELKAGFNKAKDMASGSTKEVETTKASGTNENPSQNTDQKSPEKSPEKTTHKTIKK